MPTVAYRPIASFNKIRHHHKALWSAVSNNITAWYFRVIEMADRKKAA